ncbi:MAG: tetratricopeptide repeat-containing serine protease family protein [Desulfobacula sp.]|jgi:TPR repeat protein|nr:tetratricopeptide repeat-containing serine protease family protein [Desulfobacula sp.]
MKRFLFVSILILLSVVSAFCGEFEDTLKKAEQGNADAQNNLGKMYHNGHRIGLDNKQAFYWLKKSADQGHVDGQTHLGFMYYQGEGVPQDYKQAIYWYKKSAEQGDDSAQFRLGQMYLDGKGVTQDHKQAVYWFKKSAEQGHMIAQWRLMNMYRDGKYGVAQDYKQAFYWYKKSAEQGHTSAEVGLGDMYYYGKGVTQDHKQAVYWFKKSAELGYANAQFNLSRMYYEGKSTTQNYKIAYVWESLAAAQGHNNAAKNRDITAKQLTPQQLVEAQELATQIQYKIEQQSSILHTEKVKIGNLPELDFSKKVIGSGTGFIITKDGYILNCHHVIENADEIKIAVNGKTYLATLVRDDPNNDLALLKNNGSFPAIAFSSKRSAKMGQEVFTIGYPNPSLQGVNAKITKGIVNSLTGFQDDLRLYQVSVPVQPGNSGGALLDENGNILGVIMAMLDAKTTFKISGSLPQNVNYAVKSTYAQAMLDTLPEIFDKLISPSKSKSNVVDRVKKSTVMVLSYK